MLPTTFRSIWPSCFRVEDFEKSTNQKQELSVVAMFVNGSGRNEQSLQRTSHRCILPSFGSFGKVVSEEKILQKSTNQKEELSVAAMFVNRSGRNEHYLQRTFHRCVLPSFSSFGQTVSEENNLKNQPIRNKSRLWRPCLLTDRDEMSNLYRGSSIDASYQDSVPLGLTTCILFLYINNTHLLIVGFASVLSLLPFLPLLLQVPWGYQMGSSPSGRRESLSFVSPSVIACCLTQSVNLIIFLIEQCQLNSFNAIV